MVHLRVTKRTLVLTLALDKPDPFPLMLRRRLRLELRYRVNRLLLPVRRKRRRWLASWGMTRALLVASELSEA